MTLSLFSGVGGLERGCEAAGFPETVQQVEADDFCRAVLARHWPRADRRVVDVRKACAENLARAALI